MFKDIEFKTVGEVVDYVIANGELYHYNQEERPERKLSLINGYIYWSNGKYPDTPFCPSPIMILKFKIKVKWCEYIPEGGILVKDSSGDLLVVLSYRCGKIYYSNGAWDDPKDATPVCRGEIETLMKNAPK